MMDSRPHLEAILLRLDGLANPENLAGMKRYGINTTRALGISIYELRKVAREIGYDHELALALWESGGHEARILASYVDRPEWVSEAQMERWAAGFDSWDLCDQVCDLFDRTPFAYLKVYEWSARTEEFVKRAAFAIIAGLAVHDKDASDEHLAQFLPVIVQASGDERNFVKKAVNWALRNLGKRNRRLNALAIETAGELADSLSKAARWTGRDALKELNSEKVQKRLKS
jgi:3-methyladenine DNA glycosylase AlkD